MNINNLTLTDGPKLVRRGPQNGSTLYSAYRPLRFGELYGSARQVGDGLKRALKMNKGKLPYPAIAFTGFSGTGKTTLAQILALSLNCQNLLPDSEGDIIEPCLECPRCKGILSRGLDGTDPYYLVKNTAKMKQDDIITMVENDIKSSTALISRAGGVKLICLEEAHNLTTKSIENLLLPIENSLSNSRKGRVHLLLTSSEQSTLFSNKAWQSRILNLKLQKWTTQDLFNILVDINKNEFETSQRPKVDRTVLAEIIEKSELSLRYAITLLQGILEQCKPDDGIITMNNVGNILDRNETTPQIQKLITSLINGNEIECFQFLQQANTTHSLNFDHIATIVVKDLTYKGIADLAKGNMKGKRLIEMARAFNGTINTSLYQDRFAAVALAIDAALQNK